MAGELALQTEVLRRAHQADAEQALPHAIHRYAGGQWVIGIGQPTREAKAVAQCTRRPRDAERGWHVDRDHVTGRIVGTTQQHVGGARLGHLAHHHGGGQRALQCEQGLMVRLTLRPGACSRRITLTCHGQTRPGHQTRVR